MASAACFSSRDAWLWTWEKEGDDNHMQIDYIRVYKDESIHPPEQANDCPSRR